MAFLLSDTSSTWCYETKLLPPNDGYPRSLIPDVDRFVHLSSSYASMSSRIGLDTLDPDDDHLKLRRVGLTLSLDDDNVNVRALHSSQH
jgi:hypothetical protein